MYFEKDDISKFEFSVYAAASLIELLKRQRDAVGLTFFNEKIELHTQAKSSPAHHRFLFSELEKRFHHYQEDKRVTTNTIQVLHDIAELTHRRSLVVVFSDLLDDPDRIDELFQALNHLKHNKHEVILFHVVNQSLEVDFNLENRPYQLIDMETGEKMRLQPAEVKAKYVEGIQNYFNEIKMRCANYRINFMPAPIASGYNQVLLEFLLKRQKMV
jgi:uncharacterized protein (DUF58 family)